MKTLIGILTLSAVVSFTETEAKTRKSVSTTQDSLTAPIVDAKILVKFKKVYPGIDQAMWQPTNEGYTASFKDKDITFTWVYNKKHNLGYEIKRYHGALLSVPLAERITKAYDEYDIESVEEIHIIDKVYYFVWIASNKFRKLIKMDDNEMYASETMRKENDHQRSYTTALKQE